MWDEKQKNCSSSDQTTSPKRSCGDYIYSKVIPPLGNHVDRSNGFSGKRKLAAVDITGESNIKEFRLPVGVTEQESKHGVHSKKSFADQVTSSQQFKNHDYRTGFLEVWSTSGADSRRNATDNSNDASSIGPVGSLHHNEAPSLTMLPVGENIVVPTQQAWACQNEAPISLPLSESCDAISVAAQSVTESRNSMRSRLGNHTLQDNLQHELCNTKSEHLVSARNLIQGDQINGSTEDSNKRACSHKDNKHETPYELKQSGLCSNSIVTSKPLCTEQRENCQTLQYEVQFHGSMLEFLSGNTDESDEQNHVRSPQKAAAPDMESSKKTTVDDMLSSNGSRPDRLVEDGQNTFQHHGPSKADENIKLSSGNPMITVADKLWNGRVQLSSSVTVSAVAFYKRSFQMFFD